MPQLMVEVAFVQLLSQYTAMFTAFTVPKLWTLLLLDRSPNTTMLVVTPTATTANIMVARSFCVFSNIINFLNLNRESFVLINIIQHAFNTYTQSLLAMEDHT